ncbi:MAG: hypothetical protein WC942_09270 [Clostridia bacterium]|jgi:hypothetical protein
MNDNEHAEFKKLMQATEEELAKYLEHTGVNNKYSIEEPEYLTMDAGTLRRKSPVDLASGMFQLAQYAIYIQKCINKQQAWRKWLLFKRNEVAAVAIDELGDGYGWNERRFVAESRHPLCKRINKYLAMVEMKIASLYDISAHTKTMIDTLRDMKFALHQESKVAENE